jgi:hypothetical protein
VKGCVDHCGFFTFCCIILNEIVCCSSATVSSLEHCAVLIDINDVFGSCIARVFIFTLFLLEIFVMLIRLIVTPLAKCKEFGLGCHVRRNICILAKNISHDKRNCECNVTISYQM